MVGVNGRVESVGHRAPPPPRCGPASSGGPGGWVGWGTLQVRPCMLGRRIHAAHAPSQPTLPATDGFLRTAGRSKEKEKSKAKADSSDIPDACHPRMAWIYRVDQGRHPPEQDDVPTDRGDLSKVGRCGWAGPLAPWMAPSSPQGWVHGVSCPPTPPRQPTECGLLPLTLIRRVQGCKPCRNPSPLSKPQQPAREHAPATPAAAPMPPAGHRPPESPRSPAPG